MEIELSRRVAHAFNRAVYPHPSPAERDRMVKALQTAQEFKDLPLDLQRLVETMESTDRRAT